MRNIQLKALLAESGLTYEGFAAAIRRVGAEQGDPIRTNKSAVAHWISGAHQPDARTVGYMTEALQRHTGRVLSPGDLGYGSTVDDDLMPPDPVSAVGRMARGDVDRRTLVRGAVYSLAALALPLAYQQQAAGQAHAAARGGVIGMGEVQAVRDITAAFNRADERLGGGFGRSAVVEYLATDVVSYCRATASGPVRTAMLGAAAQLAYLAGWKAHDLGLDGLAQRYYLHAYQLAQESDPGAHAGYVLRILAHQAFDLGHHAHCVDLAEEALRRNRGRVGPDTESLFWLTLGRAHAASGNPREALTAVTRAERLIETGTPDAAPEWVSMGGPPQARLANQTGKALSELGDHRAAERMFKRSAAAWNPTTHQRVHALTLADVAEEQAAQGLIEQACGTWDQALDGMVGVQSSRTREAVVSMRSRLGTFRGRGVKAAARLDARGRRVLADMA